MSANPQRTAQVISFPLDYPTSLRNAILKAQKVKCSVRILGARVYEVKTPEGHTYTVRFEQREGKRFAVCNCAASHRTDPTTGQSLACYHATHAASVDNLRRES